MSTKYNTNTAKKANKKRWNGCASKQKTVDNKLAKARESKNKDKQYDATKPLLTTKTRKWPHGYSLLDNDNQKLLLHVEDFRMVQILCNSLQVWMWLFYY